MQRREKEKFETHDNKKILRSLLKGLLILGMSLRDEGSWKQADVIRKLMVFVKILFKRTWNL